MAYVVVEKNYKNKYRNSNGSSQNHISKIAFKPGGGINFSCRLLLLKVVQITFVKNANNAFLRSFVVEAGTKKGRQVNF